MTSNPTLTMPNGKRYEVIVSAARMMLEHTSPIDDVSPYIWQKLHDAITELEEQPEPSEPKGLLERWGNHYGPNGHALIDAACAVINRWYSDAPDGDIEIDNRLHDELATALKPFTQEKKVERFVAEPLNSGRWWVEDTTDATEPSYYAGRDDAENAARHLNSLVDFNGGSK